MMHINGHWKIDEFAQPIKRGFTSRNVHKQVLINPTANRRKAKHENLAAPGGRYPKQRHSRFDELSSANVAPTRIRWQE